MSKYQIYEQHLSQLNLTEEERAFLDKVDLLILELMPAAQADVEHIADRLCIHSSKLRRSIKHMTGLVPLQYIAFIKMRRVIELLGQYPKLRIVEIADVCGYSDHAHLVHAFRRMNDTTPLGYIHQNIRNAVF